MNREKDKEFKNSSTEEAFKKILKGVGTSMKNIGVEINEELLKSYSMTREEKIERINKFLEWRKSPTTKENRTWVCDDYDEEIELFAHELLLTLLQIKPRTIDTLEVGDWIEFDYPYYGDSRLLHFTGRIEEINEYCNIRVDDDDFVSFNIINYKIIPHELLKIWGEIND